jgi:hypothetical protein
MRVENAEIKTKPAWLNVWRWSAAFACIGLIPGHIYTWYMLAGGLNAEFWGLFLLLGSLGGTLAAILGTMAGIIEFRAWKSFWSWIGFLIVVLPMIVVQISLGILGMLTISYPPARAIAVAAGGYLGGCIGVWIVPAFVSFLHRSSQAEPNNSGVSDA